MDALGNPLKIILTAGQVHRAAGPELLAECRLLHGCKTGQAKITRGYRLPARHVIHTVGPVYRRSTDPPAELTACYVASLLVADEIGAKSIAFPAISTGAYGYPLYEAARVALEAVRSARTSVERVRFVLFGIEAHLSGAIANRAEFSGDRAMLGAASIDASPIDVTLGHFEVGVPSGPLHDDG